jgi:Chain length determinant protein
MDLVSIVRALLRHKRLTITVILLTAVAGLAVIKLQPSVYSTSASVLLENPQGQATKSQISKDPSLKTASPFNPFLSYGDLDVAANAVLDLVNSPAVESELTKAGVDPRYTLTLSSDTDNPPIIDVSGVGSSAQSAIENATLLTNTIKTDLYQIQVAQGINPFYMITAVELIKPNQAYHASSGRTKSLAAVAGIGILLLFIVISASDAVDEWRRNSRRDAVAGQAEEYRRERDERPIVRGSEFVSDARGVWPPGGSQSVQGDEIYPTAPGYQRTRRSE